MFNSRHRGRTVALTMLVATITAVLIGSASFATVVSVLPGGTWAVLPDTTAGGSATIVPGPGTPPAGTGSLQLTVAENTDRALVGSDLGSLTARSWADLSASFSTFVPAGGDASFAPSLRFAGFQMSTSNFTTLSVEASRQGTVVPGQWQTWTLDADSIVWQSNASDDGFCIQSAPCTFAAFIARYPDGVWGQAQLGLGSGVAGPASGFVDAVTISDGEESQFTDFDPPAASPSPTPSPTHSRQSPTRTPSSEGTLPVTGTHDGLWLAGAGGGIAALGVGLLLVARRRRDIESTRPH
jgi:LPXTG-motif cell wall-anchored protein